MTDYPNECGKCGHYKVISRGKRQGYVFCDKDHDDLDYYGDCHHFAKKK